MAKSKTIKPTVTAKAIADWMELQDQLKRVKAEEMALRLAICQILSPDQNEGTFKYDVEGFPIKVKKSFNYKVDKKTYELLKEAFNDKEKDCIRLNPEVALKEYKKLMQIIEQDENNEIDIDRLQECITITPATPTLTVGTASEDDEE
jgi:hypothetical protein